MQHCGPRARDIMPRARATTVSPLLEQACGSGLKLKEVFGRNKASTACRFPDSRNGESGAMLDPGRTSQRAGVGCGEGGCLPVCMRLRTIPHSSSPAPCTVCGPRNACHTCTKDTAGRRSKHGAPSACCTRCGKHGGAQEENEGQAGEENTVRRAGGGQHSRTRKRVRVLVRVRVRVHVLVRMRER